jgi:hypothetical protein
MLRLTKKTESELAVVKRLAEICPRYPVSVPNDDAVLI